MQVEYCVYVDKKAKDRNTSFQPHFFRRNMAVREKRSQYVEMFLNLCRKDRKTICGAQLQTNETWLSQKLVILEENYLTKKWRL